MPHDHRTAFALALRPISPSLAALHASRIKLEHDHPLTPLTCPRCGHAPLHVRSVRHKGKGTIKRTCAVCDLVEALPAPRGDASRFESTRKRRRKMFKVDASSAGPSSPRVTPTPASTSKDEPTHPLPDPIPKRPKKKSGLQELLARNRQRQEKQKQDAQHSAGGLSSFLDGL